MARILIVDDEPMILQLLKANLEMEGHEASLASDGSTAVRRIETEAPELVLLDIMMPVLDGWGVLQAVGELRRRKRPRVIVMTAKAGEQARQQAMRLGADELLTKPFDVDDVLEAVERVLGYGEEELEQRRRAWLQPGS